VGGPAKRLALGAVAEANHGPAARQRSSPYSRVG
jgi:hypothetical protein